MIKFIHSRYLYPTIAYQNTSQDSTSLNTIWRSVSIRSSNMRELMDNIGWYDECAKASTIRTSDGVGMGILSPYIHTLPTFPQLPESVYDSVGCVDLLYQNVLLYYSQPTMVCQSMDNGRFHSPYKHSYKSVL